MHLSDVITYWAKTDPHRPALIQPDMAIDYKSLVDAIVSIEKRIVQLGLDRQEPIGVSLAVPAYFIATVLAIVRSGYDAALVNPRRFPLLRSAGIRNLIYDSEGLVMSGGRNIRFDKSWLPGPGSVAAKLIGEEPQIQVGNLIFFTSGTTGLPKKVVQSAKALDALLQYPVTCASGNHQNILVMPGLSSTLGFNRVCEILAAGKTAFFSVDATTAVSLISTFDVEIIVASAAQALSLAEFTQTNRGCDLASLKALFVAGGKIEPKRMADVRAAICRNILIQYGSTETGVVTLHPFGSSQSVPGAVGTILPWVEMEIVDESGQILPPGSTGLVRYRTPQLMANIEVAGSASIPGVRDRWFYPGDIGSLSADGLLSLAGRTSDVINRAGIKVSGTRIEEILQELPQINEAAACGVIAPSGIEEIWVAIVLNGPVDTADIKRQLEEHADVRISPDQIFVVDELPRGELGKIQKHRLAAMLQNLHQEN